MIGKKATHPDYLNDIYVHKLNRPSEILGTHYFFKHMKATMIKRRCEKTWISQIVTKTNKISTCRRPKITTENQSVFHIFETEIT